MPPMQPDAPAVTIYVAHLGLTPQLESCYRAALEPLKLGKVDIRALVAGQGYPAYEAVADRWEAKYGSVEAGLFAELGEPEGHAYLAGFSAGGALLRRHAKNVADGRPHRIRGMVELDSLYASEVGAPPKPVHERIPAAQMADLVAYARRAADPHGDVSFASGASDVDPVIYASTGETAEYLAESVGLALRPVLAVTRPVAAEATRLYPRAGFSRWRVPVVAEAGCGRLLVRKYDARAGAGGDEHAAAANGWGGVLLAELVALDLGLPAPWPRDSIFSDPDDARLSPHMVQPGSAYEMQRVVRTEADGVPGPLTLSALHAWQAEHALPVGDAWAKLGRDLADVWEGECLVVHISKHQPGAIDWNALLAQGVFGVVLRVAVGATFDDTFDARWHESEKMFARGAYCVPVRGAGTEAEAIAQAKLVGRRIGPLGSDCLPAVLDVEPLGRVNGTTEPWPASCPSPEQLVAFFDCLADLTGKAPMTYSSPFMWPAGYGDLLARRGSELWVADGRGSSLQRGWPGLPKGWVRWRMWQKGTRLVRGVTGQCDYNAFGGNILELRRFTTARVSIAT